MKELTVNLGKKYKIIIEPDILKNAGAKIKELGAFCRIAIVTDDIVEKLYLDELKASLRTAGFTGIASYVMPHGEKSKSLETVGKLYTFFIENNITRTDIIIALGGGVVGDVTGFAASTFLRGIRVVQVPTTLLAQVDSSVGGKTAVDLPNGKNLVGSFWQPSLVLCDILLLKTLTPVDFAEGAAEIIKCAAISDIKLFEMISNSNYYDNIEEIIYRSIFIKKTIVEADEYDTGERMILNFGHTLAHAIEQKSGYKTTHGKAVSMGMAMITRASTKAGITLSGTSDALEKACGLFLLPVTTGFTPAQLTKAYLEDKKRDGNNINIILLEKIGKAAIHKMPLSDFESFVLEAYK
ncbi:MAG: 3-dehydroquinate synthase [Hydrogenoanaerobacterium sp.]